MTSRIQELLAGAEGDVIAEALREILGVAAALRAVRVERGLDLEVRTSSGWRLHGDANAARRDGVQVGLQGPYARFSRIDPVPWVAMFYPEAGGLQPNILLSATDIAGAITEVDARWPMPEWWKSVDRLPDARA